MWLFNWKKPKNGSSYDDKWISDKFTEIGNKLDTINTDLKSITTRVDTINTDLKSITARVDRLEGSYTSHFFATRMTDGVAAPNIDVSEVEPGCLYELIIEQPGFSISTFKKLIVVPNNTFVQATEKMQLNDGHRLIIKVDKYGYNINLNFSEGIDALYIINKYTIIRG